MENQNTSLEKNAVSAIEKIISFFFPLLGVILYLCFKGERDKPGEYLRFAGYGVLTCVLLTCLTTCVGCVGALGAASSCPY